MALGFTHRGAVLVIYGIASIFAFISILLQFSSRIGGILLVIVCLFGLEIFIELVGILGENRQPVLKALKFVGNSSYRDKVLHSDEDADTDENEEDIENHSMINEEIDEPTQEFPIQNYRRSRNKK